MFSLFYLLVAWYKPLIEYHVFCVQEFQCATATSNKWLPDRASGKWNSNGRRRSPPNSQNVERLKFRAPLPMSSGKKGLFEIHTQKSKSYKLASKKLPTKSVKMLQKRFYVTNPKLYSFRGYMSIKWILKKIEFFHCFRCKICFLNPLNRKMIEGQWSEVNFLLATLRVKHLLSQCTV